MKTLLLLLLLPACAFAQIRRPYTEAAPMPPPAYNWKGAIAPASMSFAAGAFHGRDNTSKFVRQGFLIGAALTIGFGSAHRRPGWHYAVDVAACAVGFMAGRLVGESVNYR